MFARKSRLPRLAAAALAALTVAVGYASTAADPAAAAVSSSGPQTKVVGGYAPHPSQWPWMASIQDHTAHSNDYYQHFCGGALIHPRIVLTAAHCIVHPNGSPIRPTANLEVMLGKRRLSDPGGEQIRVAQARYVSSYNSPVSFAHDLAFLILDRPSYMTPATMLRADYQLQEGFAATTMGWGRTQGGNANSGANDLKALDLTLWSDSRCQSVSGSYHWASTICAAHSTQKADSVCQGDSGSPMMLRDANGSWYLAGLTSWVHGDCLANGYPAAFTRLQNATLNQTIWQLVAEVNAAGTGNGSGYSGEADNGSDDYVADYEEEEVSTYGSSRSVSFDTKLTSARVRRAYGNSVLIAVVGYNRATVTVSRGKKVVFRKTIVAGLHNRPVAIPRMSQVGKYKVAVRAFKAGTNSGATRTLSYTVVK